MNEPVNLLNGLLFVSDYNYLDNIIKPLREKGYNVNEGPQPLRGCLNSLSSFFSKLESNYRASLYYHHCYHYDVPYVFTFIPFSYLRPCALHIRGRDYVMGPKLDRKAFYFENFHKKLGGGVRYYSTKPAQSTMTTKALVHKYFNIHKEVHKQLENILSNSPINEETQMKL